MTRHDPYADLQQHPDILMAVTRLPAGKAWWLPLDRAIVLDDRLTQVERRCALQHELEHVEAGDTACDHHLPDGGRLGRRQERAADQRAARRLIELDELADALVWCLGPDEVAEHLHVTPWAVTARLRALTAEEKDYIKRRLSMREASA